MIYQLLIINIIIPEINSKYTLFSKEKFTSNKNINNLKKISSLFLQNISIKCFTKILLILFKWYIIKILF